MNKDLHLADGDARDEALNVQHSYIVQAPAGSGKTTLLISRFICLLASAEQPEEILAITFTRKATAEMRNRIIEALDPSTHTEFPQQSANRALQAVRERSKEKNWNLLEQPARLQIMTIDAFCTGLVRRMPWTSRFGSLPGIVEDASLLYETAALNLFESASQNDELQAALMQLLKHLDNNSTKLQGLLVQMLTKRDQWLRMLLRTSFSNQDKSAMESLWQRFIETRLDQVRSKLPPRAREKLGVNTLDHADPGSLQKWKKICSLLLVQKGTWRKAGFMDSHIIHEISAFKMNSIADLCREDEQLAAELKEIRDDLPAPEYEKEDWQMLAACSIVLQHAVAELRVEFQKRSVVDFIEIAQQAVDALGTEDNPTDLSLVLDYQYRHIMVDEFQDTSVSQRALLELLIAGWQSDDGRTLFLVGDPMQSIYRFRNAEVGIFLSVLERGLGQLNIRPLRLTRNFRSTEKVVEWFNSVFEPSFPSESDLASGSVSYAKCTADEKSRNSKPVKVWLQTQNDERGLKVDRSVLQDYEALQLIRDLERFRKKNPGPDVRAAILVRARTHAYTIIDHLVDKGIKFYATDLIPLSERPVVQDLLSLTRALLNLADRTSWMAILRAPWCGLSLRDLLTIAGDKRAVIWDQLNDEEIISALSEDGGQRVLRLREVLSRSFSVRGRFEARQWIEDCWLLLGGPACVEPHDYENARLFLDLVERNATGTSIDNLNRFEEKIATLYAVPETRPEDVWLQISTIHGVKGLEYDAVFLPRFHADRVGFPDKPLLVWSEIMLDGIDNQMLLSPILSTGVDTRSSMYQFLRNWDKKRNRIELLRLAYVACTRAKSALHIYGVIRNQSLRSSPGTRPPPPASSMLGLIWPGIVASEYASVNWRRNMSYLIDSGTTSNIEYLFSSGERAESSVEFNLVRLPADWQMPAPPAAVAMPDVDLESGADKEKIDFDWAGSVALWVGNVVHEWLEKIVRTGVRSWDTDRLAGEREKWKTTLLSMGMTTDRQQIDDALKRIEKALNNVLEDPKGQWILSDEHTQSAAELRLTGYVNGQFSNVILDRTFIDRDGTRWIIDYKSGTTTGNVENFLDQEVERYRDQLSSYRSIISGMEANPIRTALYFPMFPAWREVTHS